MNCVSKKTCFIQTAKVISFHQIVSSNKLLHSTRDYDIVVGRIPEVRDTVLFRYCTLYAGVRKNPINRYTQSMLVILSGSRDLHWLIGMLVYQCTHKQALNIASDLGEA